jgi:hypothetical protein
LKDTQTKNLIEQTINETILRKCRKFIKLNHEYWDIKEPITTVSSNKGSGD